jgi:histidyl-tRNA synthetase
MDKFDKFGVEGVALLLGKGRKDDSGDFTKGAGLGEGAVKLITEFLSIPTLVVEAATVLTTREQYDEHRKAIGPEASEELQYNERAQLMYAYSNSKTLDYLRMRFGSNPKCAQGIEELATIAGTTYFAGYRANRVRIDPSVVRGLEYYTGPVFEAELTFEVKDDDGKPVRFGSVGGGGRYDDLVARFTGEKVPATGFSIGVSRLQAALSLINDKKSEALGPVVVLVMDKAEVATYQKMTQALRNAGIRAEMYLGSSGMKAQMKYADKRNSPCVIIQGSDERAKGEVTIKDLIEGAKAAAAIKDNKEWKEARPAQFSVSEANLIQEVHKLIKRHQE